MHVYIFVAAERNMYLSWQFTGQRVHNIYTESIKVKRLLLWTTCICLSVQSETCACLSTLLGTVNNFYRQRVYVYWCRVKRVFVSALYWTTCITLILDSVYVFSEKRVLVSALYWAPCITFRDNLYMFIGAERNVYLSRRLRRQVAVVRRQLTRQKRAVKQSRNSSTSPRRGSSSLNGESFVVSVIIIEGLAWPR